MKRIKKWITILPILLVTAILGLSPATAMAESEDGTVDNPDHPYTGSLAIVAPRMARTDQRISMTVFLRWDQTPFEGAGVWAFTRDEAEIMREEVNRLTQDKSTSVDKKDYEALASVHGTFIGTTGADGKLYYSFAARGGYMLAAVKRGYYPGFTSIFIGTTPKALVLDAPDKARVGEDVTMTVTQRDTGAAIDDAGIWSLTKENAEALKAELEAIRESSAAAAEDIDYESLADIYGVFLGRTDLNGQLTHAFGEEGGYMLISVKRGYIPGRSGIRIGEPTIRALALETPGKAFVGEEVTMAVYHRGTTEPVEGAGVWALSRDKMGSLQADMTALRENSSIAAEEKNYESLMDLYGEFLGRTDQNGKLTHVFDEKGGYLLITAKQGYFPGWGGLRIIGSENAENPLKNDVTPYHSGNITRINPDVLKPQVIDDDTF